jgi:hypothetical protein
VPDFAAHWTEFYDMTKYCCSAVRRSLRTMMTIKEPSKQFNCRVPYKSALQTVFTLLNVYKIAVIRIYVPQLMKSI